MSCNRLTTGAPCSAIQEILSRCSKNHLRNEMISWYSLGKTETVFTVWFHKETAWKPVLIFVDVWRCQFRFEGRSLVAWGLSRVGRVISHFANPGGARREIMVPSLGVHVRRIGYLCLLVVISMDCPWFLSLLEHCSSHCLILFGCCQIHNYEAGLRGDHHTQERFLVASDHWKAKWKQHKL